MTKQHPEGTDRRGFLRGAGLLGTAAAAAAATPAAARERRGGYLWLAGDHHLHSPYRYPGKCSGL
ncbi:hypothetical protein [Glycomyces sp. MUSA5-2]|uniref:hypothetical protein n=1 Tax=Glycomyces sp. MUSA5-2 TaxID=2053002 RepID=UPI003007F8B9